MIAKITAGRPKGTKDGQGKGSKRIRYMCSMYPHHKAILEAKAKELGVKLAEVVRHAIEAYCE